jgi:hypothetical protein
MAFGRAPLGIAIVGLDRRHDRFGIRGPVTGASGSPRFGSRGQGSLHNRRRRIRDTGAATGGGRRLHHIVAADGPTRAKVLPKWAALPVLGSPHVGRRSPVLAARRCADRRGSVREARIATRSSNCSCPRPARPSRSWYSGSPHKPLMGRVSDDRFRRIRRDARSIDGLRATAPGRRPARPGPVEGARSLEALQGAAGNAAVSRAVADLRLAALPLAGHAADGGLDPRARLLDRLCTSAPTISEPH